MEHVGKYHCWLRKWYFPDFGSETTVDGYEGGENHRSCSREINFAKMMKIKASNEGVLPTNKTEVGPADWKQYG